MTELPINDIMHGDPSGKTPHDKSPGEITPPADAVTLSKWRIIVRRFFRNKPATFGLLLFGAVVVWAIIGNLPNHWSATDFDLINTASPPSSAHWFGTGQAGGDIYAQTVAGTRKSLLIGGLVGIITPIIAVIYGCAIAYFGKQLEFIGMFILEVLLMMPVFTMLSIAMQGGGGGTWLILVAVLTAFGWMGNARLVRSLAKSLVGREYITAARYMGVSHWKIITRHLVPNIASLTVLNITTGVWGAIGAEVAFAVIGIGVKPPETSLGLLIARGQNAVQTYPWTFLPPLIVLILITIPLALINDGVRDALDPNSDSGGRGEAA